MDGFEYAIGLFSVGIGLALADIAVSTHRLLKRAGEVRWDPLAFATTAYVGLLLVAMWYDLWSVRDMAGVTGFWLMLALQVELLLLFLLSAAALPDEDDGLDLFAYYDRQQRYIWTLMLAFGGCYLALWSYFQWARGLRPDLLHIGLQVAPLLGYLALFLVRNRPVQIAIIALLVLKLVTHDYGYSRL